AACWRCANRNSATSGVAVRAVGTHTDVTGRREMEEALRRQTEALSRSNAELEAFAYVASHDLRQPLRTVNSYAALLERELGAAVSDDAKEFIGFIRDGAKRMDRLVVDLLEYSRVGRNCAPFSPVSTATTAQDAVANLNAALLESGGAVVISPDLPTVRGDESELLRLFQNLIGNAIKYRHPDRPPQIVVTAESQDDHLLFSVADNGIGVAPQHFERIFGIFQRLHGPSDGVEGTGVGLALCKKIVEHHGGRIWVESAPAEGCVFRFSLPRP
ncbi:MAG TPA: ATP-binding protein, partial [Azospirillaceae bacterium]|nr:ATP-binding protein [Azospirillaceae bacterium]